MINILGQKKKWRKITNMTFEQKTFNFTGVDNESNNRLIKDLEMGIALIEPTQNLGINIPSDLKESITALKERLNLYQGFLDYQDEIGHLPEYKPTAKLYLKNGGYLTVDITEEGHVDIDDLKVWVQGHFLDFEDYIKFDQFKVKRSDINYIAYDGIKVFDSADYKTNPLIAMIIYKDASGIPIDCFGSGDITVQEIVSQIKKGIKEGKNVEIGCSTIKVSDVWEVMDGETEARYLINSDNDPKQTPISEQTIPLMGDTELLDTLDMFLDGLTTVDTEEDLRLESTIDLLDVTISELRQRYNDKKADAQQLENIFNMFVDEYELHSLFNKFIEESKRAIEEDRMLKEEVFGDLDRFVKEFYEKGRRG